MEWLLLVVVCLLALSVCWTGPSKARFVARVQSVVCRKPKPKRKRKARPKAKAKAKPRVRVRAE